MKSMVFLFAGLFLLPVQMNAQVATEMPPPNYIRSVIFTGNSEFSGTPIVPLGTPLILRFDDIIGDEADYYYSIEHFNYDWTPSELAESEYLEGFDNIRIQDYENSYNTLLLYSHYRLQIPNQDTKGIKVSGNYLLSIYNENKELVFSRKFIVYEPLAQVSVEIKRSRDVKFIHTKQVVNFTVDPGEIILKNPKENVVAVILQNNNFKTAIHDIQPQYTIGNELVYKYDQPTSFWAGNEYLSYDSKDLRAATVHVQRIDVQDLYHHYLYPNKVRAFEPYTYNPDINGDFVLRTMQGTDPNIEAEYVWTHFSLESYEPMEGGQLHLYGSFNNFTLDESTRLTYNQNKGIYEVARLFKQGFYNYKYVLLRSDGSLDEGFISGNFGTTENDYSVVVYYRPLGGRYDRVIGLGTGNSTNITN